MLSSTEIALGQKRKVSFECHFSFIKIYEGGEYKNIREKITQKSRPEIKQFEPAWQQNDNYFAALTTQPLENPINSLTQTISSKDKMWGAEEELFKKDVVPSLDVATPHQVIQEMDSKSIDDWESVAED